MSALSDSKTWKWRLIIRFFGFLLSVVPFMINLHISNIGLALLAVLAGFALVIVS